MTVTDADRTARDIEATDHAVEVRAAYRTFEQDIAPVRIRHGHGVGFLSDCALRR